GRFARYCWCCHESSPMYRLAGSRASWARRRVQQWLFWLGKSIVDLSATGTLPRSIRHALPVPCAACTAHIGAACTAHIGAACTAHIGAACTAHAHRIRSTSIVELVIRL